MARPRRSWLALLGLVPCLASAGVALLPRAEPLPVPARSLPPLAFDQFGVSYGEIGPYPVVEGQFTFRNLGLKPVTIEKVEPSCGCLRWRLQGNQRTYRPGEPGCLTVQLHTANERPGPHHYEIDVVAVGDATQRERLSFRVTLPRRKITVDPPEVYFYRFNGEPDERLVQLYDSRADQEQPLAILAAESTSPLVTVETLPAERSPEGWRLPMRLTSAGEVPTRRTTALVKIRTDDPELPLIAVPVLIEGLTVQPVAHQVYGPPPPDAAPFDVGRLLELRHAALPATNPH